MGIDVTAEVMIGVWMEKDEAEKFVSEKGTILYDMPEPDDDGICWKWYSEYSCTSGCLGIGVVESDLLCEKKNENIKEYFKTLKNYFPIELHGRIEPHIWARYW